MYGAQMVTFNKAGAISDMQVTLGKYHSSTTLKVENDDLSHMQSEEATIRNIMKYEKSFAAIFSQLKCHRNQAAHFRDVLGVVATLGKINDDNLSRLCALSNFSFIKGVRYWSSKLLLTVAYRKVSVSLTVGIVEVGWCFHYFKGAGHVFARKDGLIHEGDVEKRYREADEVADPEKGLRSDIKLLSSTADDNANQNTSYGTLLLDRGLTFMMADSVMEILVSFVCLGVVAVGLGGGVPVFQKEGAIFATGAGDDLPVF
ncbi:hypothetical protein Tco_0271398 [Tanacetum coccineum]